MLFSKYAEDIVLRHFGHQSSSAFMLCSRVLVWREKKRKEKKERKEKKRKEGEKRREEEFEEDRVNREKVEEEGDNQNWILDDGETDASFGEEEDETPGFWENTKGDLQNEESVIAESVESAQKVQVEKEKTVNEAMLEFNGSGKDNMGKGADYEMEPNFVFGPNENWVNKNVDICQPNGETEDKKANETERSDDFILQRGEMSDKLKKLSSGNVPIEEKLVLVGSDLTETQRKIRVKEGRVSSSINLERRVTRSQTKMWRRKNEGERISSMGQGVDIDSSISVGVLQRLEEAGIACDMQEGGAGGIPVKGSTKNGGKNGNS
ncbi:hypothetical protein L1887_18563 [Cichorium endivia]|nr:hypothetical protein L1887_18563 [Cichorium endivia]